MKSLGFLHKLGKEGKVSVVESSEEISASYEKKGIECREVAKLAFDNGYFESAITQSYYSMYNHVLSLFFKCGIKCENHSASSILLKEFFGREDLGMIFSKAKEERIDKQYYVAPSQDNPATRASAQEMVGISTNFNPQITAFKINLQLREIERIKNNLRAALHPKKNYSGATK